MIRFLSAGTPPSGEAARDRAIGGTLSSDGAHSADCNGAVPRSRTIAPGIRARVYAYGTTLCLPASTPYVGNRRSSRKHSRRRPDRDGYIPGDDGELVRPTCSRTRRGAASPGEVALPRVPPKPGRPGPSVPASGKVTEQGNTERGLRWRLVSMKSVARVEKEYTGNERLQAARRSSSPR